MLDIGDCCLMAVGNNGHFVLSKVLKYFDTMGLNILSFYKDDSIKPFIDNKIKYKDVGELLKLISENLFRLDCILVQSDYDIIKYIRKVSKLPIIIVTESDDVESELFDYKYKFSVRRDSNFSLNIENLDREYYIENMSTGVDSSFEELKKAHVRDFKINEIFNKNKIK